MLSGTLITRRFWPLALAQGMVAEFTKSLSIVVFMALSSYLGSPLFSLALLGYKIIENKAPAGNEWTKRPVISSSMYLYA